MVGRHECPEFWEYFRKQHGQGINILKPSKMLELRSLNDPVWRFIPWNTLKYTWRYKLGSHLSVFYVDFGAGYPA